jgi:hypothetical protein
MRFRRGVAVAFFLVLIAPCFAEKPPIASDVELAAISARGRLLYEYDQAAWHSTDAVQATRTSKESIGRYIARKKDAGWEVVWGNLNEARDEFLIRVIATQGASPHEFAVKSLDVPRSDTEFYLSAARAIEIAIKSYHGFADRPYNTAVLPAPAGQLYVYLVPGQTEDDNYPLGSDVRFLVSADGNSIIETRQLHKSIIPKASIPAGAQIAAGTHTHFLSDIPEDSDVLCVLTRKPSIPEYVVTQVAIYVVNADGSIRFVQRMKK